MRGRLPAAAAFAGVALLLAAGQVAWVLRELGTAGDGPAFAVGLVGSIAVPTLLALSGAALLHRAGPLVRACLVGAVAAAGLSASGFVAGVFIADDPRDPAWIGWFAAAAPFAFPVAIVLSGLAWWRLLRGVPGIARPVAAAVLAVASTAVGTFFILQTVGVWLAALALPVALVVLRLRTGRATAHEPEAELSP